MAHAQFEWDFDKALANQQKHGVAFADAVTARKDDYALTIEDDHPGERRFIPWAWMRRAGFWWSCIPTEEKP
jgi:uncharacterized DUF497 family protein